VNAVVKDQVDWLKRKHPQYLISFPSNLVTLADYCLEHNITFAGLKGVRTVGETLRPEYRRLIESAWGAKVTDIYTCEEAGYLAIQCPHGDHYHVQSENVILEVLNEKNEPCAVGEPGRIIVTSLHNYAMPLIRYDVGDAGVLGERCACGRGLPVLKEIHGRQRSLLKLADGSKRFPYLGEHGQILKVSGIKPAKVQVVQESLDTLVIKLVSSEKVSREQAGAIETLYAGLLGAEFNYTVRQVDDIPKGNRGKYQDFVCEC